MHQFIQQVQERSLPHKLRVKTREETAKAIETLINEADPIPGVGKLVAKITVFGEEVSVQLGVKRQDSEASNWWEVEWREIGHPWWRASGEDGSPDYHRTLDEAQEAAKAWAAQAHNHVDGRMRYYDARIIQVAEQRRTVEVVTSTVAPSSSTPEHTQG